MEISRLLQYLGLANTSALYLIFSSILAVSISFTPLHMQSIRILKASTLTGGPPGNAGMNFSSLHTACLSSYMEPIFNINSGDHFPQDSFTAEQYPLSPLSGK
jgi:hypothetical protein